MTREELIEASIDHMTAKRYRDVVAMERLHAKSRYKVSPNPELGSFMGGKYVGDHDIGAKRISDRRMIGLVVDPDMDSEGAMNKLTDYLSPKGKSRMVRRKLARGRIMTLPTPRKDRASRRHTKGVIAHELMHALDPGDQPRKGIRPPVNPQIVGFGDTKRPIEAYKNYYASPRERHAYAAIAGTLGVRDVKKTGATAQQARDFLRRGGNPVTPGKKGVRKDSPAIAKNRHIAWRGAWANIVSPAESYRRMLTPRLGPRDIRRRLRPTRARKQQRKSAQKFFKEIHKGMERQYGRKYTPKRKLPEEARDWLNNLK